MLSPQFSRIAVAIALVLTVAACSGSDDQQAMDQQAADAASQPAVPTQDMSGDAGAPLTSADLDAYERGMKKEMEIVQDLVKQAEGTTDDAKQLEIMTAALEDQTMDDGAQAAGMPLDRYRALRNRMTEVLSASSFSIMGAALRDQARQSEAQLDSLAGQGLTAEQIAQSRKNVQEMKDQLDAQERTTLEMIAPDAREAFKQRALRLDSLRMNTVGLRLKVAS